ncbi:helix-turn-helix transcriptional regulator [Pseudomonas putida]|uniref:Transcriptional regulator n=1 Tax=Pseudomonas putida TaxID=303 RepID=A0A177SX23_PSEPU|nr:AlpA family transcriptional regulator [Pseudomonas putida]OAI94851.1 transcriptional regulator [Pseudomonas putida]
MDVATPTSVDAPDNRLLRRSEVERITGLKRSQLYNLIKKGKFPRQVHLGIRAVGWSSAEIAEWVNDRLQDRK